MGEGSGDHILDPVDILRNYTLTACLFSMKAINRLPFAKLDAQIENLEKYLEFDLKDTHFTFVTLTKETKIPLLAKQNVLQQKPY